MKTFVIIFILIFCTGLVFITITSKRADNRGINEIINLSKGEKLVNLTWKGDSLNDLWFLTRPMTPDDIAQTYSFQEKSSCGILEKISIVESK